MKSDGSEGSALGAGTMSDDGRFAVIASGQDLIVGDENGDGHSHGPRGQHFRVLLV